VEWVEISGRTLEEAKEQALEQLGVAESDAEWVVLAEPKVGLFGRTRGEARVRARVRPVGPRPKRQRRPRRGGGERQATDRAGEGERGDPNGQRRSGPEGSARRRRRRGKGPGSGAGSARVSPAERPAGGEVREGKEADMAEEGTREEQAVVAQSFLEGLLDAYGYEATVETRFLDEDVIEVSATGDELGLLVGPRGRTLAALQDVVRTVVQHQFPSHAERIVVDVAGYRQRRIAALQRFTRQIAEEVLTSGVERALEPMAPADRKVVHDTINEIPGLSTRSEGEDADRHVVIVPSS